MSVLVPRIGLRATALFGGRHVAGSYRFYSVKGKLDDDDDLNFDAVDVLKKPAPGEQSDSELRSFDWYSRFQKAPPKGKKTVSKRVKNLQNELNKYTTMETIEKLAPDFLAAFNNSLIDFGDNFLGDAVEEEDTLRAIAETEGKEVAYYQAAVGLLKGQTDIEILNSRLETPREEFDDEIYSRFVDELNKDEESFNIQSLLQEYAKLPVPRAKHIQPEDLELFLEQFKLYAFYLNVELVDLVFQDVIDAGMMITQEELHRSLSCQLATGKVFGQEAYQEFSKVITETGFALNIDSYNMFLTACVVSKNTDLFGQILNDINEAGLQPSRTTFQLMAVYSGLSKDINKLLNLLEIRLVTIPLLLDASDISSFAGALMDVGQPQLANDLINIPLLMRDMCLHHHELDLAEYQERSLENELKLIPYHSPLEMFDFLTRNMTLFPFYPDVPEWTFDVYAERCETFQDIRGIVENVVSNNIGVSIPVAVKYMELFYKERESLKRDELLAVTTELLSSTEDKALFLLTNPAMIQLVVDLAQHFVKTGELSNNSVTTRALQDLQHELQSGAELSTEDAFHRRLRNVSSLLSHPLQEEP
ncbi:hypothetical protein OGAPHI_005462 [Ogataea philodendri]|uniref:Uncharacterized protein n=2 Tax=Saccharomycotina TaxID=147537 RepID=A0A9P8NZA1_9ASCO|nr:uncharacterized protein OGAPHI_005462 [Ogataea philodendri]KAH3662214.1 hypothetical protein OGAPHI_005462 [Ogataea philodendri]